MSETNEQFIERVRMTALVSADYSVALLRRDLETAIEKLREAERDARRYRWIRNSLGHGDCRYSFWDRDNQECVMTHRLDKTIDQAIAEGEKK